MLGTASLCRAQETSSVRDRRARSKKVVRTALAICKGEVPSIKTIKVKKSPSDLQIDFIGRVGPEKAKAQLSSIRPAKAIIAEENHQKKIINRFLV